MTVEDVRRASKLLDVELTDEHVKEVAAFLTSNIPILLPLIQKQLPKEVEPAPDPRTLSVGEGA